MRAPVLALALPLACAALLFGADARATTVVPSTSVRVDVRSVDVAIAATPERTTTWIKARFSSTGGTVVWFVPVHGPAAVDVASEAWLEGLDLATAPRVGPPRTLSTPSCKVATAIETIPPRPPHPRRPPLEARVLTTTAELDAYATTWQLVRDASFTKLAAGVLDTKAALLALPLATTAGDLETATVRLVGPAREPALPLALTSPGPVVTAFSLATSRSVFGAGLPLQLDPSRLAWQRTGSNYAELRASLLAFPGFLTESSGHAPIFDGVALPGGDVTVSAVETYFERAATYGDAIPQTAACRANARSWGARFETVGMACPRGALLRIGDLPCTETVGAGELDPREIRCGALSDDLALAITRERPGAMGVTRAMGQAMGEVKLGSGGGARSVYQEASRLDVTCTDSGAPLAPPTAAGGASPPPLFSAEDDTSGGGGAGGSVGGSCQGGVYADDSSGCGGDSSTAASESSSDDSASDTTTSDDTTPSDEGADGGGDGCSSDGSSTGESASSSDDGCGGAGSSSDSSSSSSDDGCGSGGSSSSSGDGCGSSSSASSAMDARHYTRRRPPVRLAVHTVHAQKRGAKKSPVSRSVLLFAALALPLRRLARKGLRGSPEDGGR